MPLHTQTDGLLMNINELRTVHLYMSDYTQTRYTKVTRNTHTWHISGTFAFSQQGWWFLPSAIHLTMFGKSFSHDSGSVPVVPSNILCTVQNPMHISDTFNDWQQSVKSCVINGSAAIVCSGSSIGGKTVDAPVIVSEDGAEAVFAWVVEFNDFTKYTEGNSFFFIHSRTLFDTCLPRYIEYTSYAHTILPNKSINKLLHTLSFIEHKMRRFIWKNKITFEWMKALDNRITVHLTSVHVCIGRDGVLY